jgi:hypothetical protein
MSKQKQIYEKMLSYRPPIHKFGNNYCIFFSGFKFEKDVGGDVEVYRCYNTRTSIYRELSDEDMDYILKNGVFQASARDSYKSYGVLFKRYGSVINNKRSSKKMIDKAEKILKEYSDRCMEIIDRYPSLSKELTI